MSLPLGPLQEWLGNHLGTGRPTVTGVERLPGGASLETFRVRCRIKGESGERRLVLRRSPESALIDTEREVELAALDTFFGSDVPVPEPIGFEPRAQVLGGPFFVAAEVPDCYSEPRILDEARWDPHRDSLGHQFWSILGTIARTECTGTPLAKVLPPATAETAWKDALDHWEAVIAEDSVAPDPLLTAALGALRQNPPPAPERLVVVHGDYRTGNVLFDVTGMIRSVLDWEMCHLGDPLEDIGWALSPLWSGPDPDLVGRLVPREAALRTWTAVSGGRVDDTALAWWELLAAVKGSAIWLSAGTEFATGRNRDLMMLQAAWVAGTRQRRFLAEKLLTFLESI